LKKTLWTLALAVAVYTAIILLSDIGSVGTALSSISLLWIPAFLSLSLINYFLRFLKWQYFLRRIGLTIPWRESLGVFLAGFSMTVSPGKLGELLKCYLLRDSRGIPVSRTSTVVVAERVTDLISMLFIALAGLLLVRDSGAGAAVAAGLVFTALVMILLVWRRAFDLVTGIVCRIGPLARFRSRLNEFHCTASKLLSVDSLAVSVPLGILSWGAEALVLCLVGLSLGLEPPVTVGLALLAHAAGTVAGAVSMIPGGLGLTEITIGAVLLTTMSETDAAVVTLVMRFATLWFAVLIGVLVLWRIRRSRGRMEH